MGSEVVVFFDGFFEFAPDFIDGVGGEVVVVIEFLSECTVGSLNAPIVFWLCMWDDKEFDVAPGAGLLEFASELGYPVDLDGFDFEGGISMRSRRNCHGCAGSIWVGIGVEAFGFPVTCLELTDFVPVFAYRHVVGLHSLAETDGFEVPEVESFCVFFKLSRALNFWGGG